MNIDVDKPTIKEKCTALMEAAKAGHADIVCLLLSHGANVNAHSATSNFTILYILFNRITCILYLILST